MKRNAFPCYPNQHCHHANVSTCILILIWAAGCLACVCTCVCVCLRASQHTIWIPAMLNAHRCCRRRQSQAKAELGSTPIFPRNNTRPLGICFCVSVRTLRIRCKMDFGKRACSYHRSIMCACACVHVAGRFISSAKIPIHHEFAYVLHTPTRLRWVLSAGAAAVRRRWLCLLRYTHARTHKQKAERSKMCFDGTMRRSKRASGIRIYFCKHFIFIRPRMGAQRWQIFGALRLGMQSVAMRYIIFAPRKHGHANTHKVFCAHGADAWKRGCTWASWILIRAASSLSNIICNAVWCAILIADQSYPVDSCSNTHYYQYKSG